MGDRTHIQRDFSGGVISRRMLMRQDTDVYKKSALVMQNYMPTPQGSALRVPGTRYVETLDDDEIRIFPYLSPANERSLIKLTPLEADLVFNVNDSTRDDYSNVEVSGGTLVFRRRINENHAFGKGLTNWQASPAQYTARDGFPGLGVYIKEDTNYVTMRPRIYNDPGDGVSPVTLETSAEVDVATDRITMDYRATYGSNWSFNGDPGGYRLTVVVSNLADYTNELYSRVWDDVTNPNIGAALYEETAFDLPTAAWTGTLYVKITAEARPNADSQYSAPVIDFSWLSLYANGEVTITASPATLTTPYTAAQLPIVQYEQSPYDPKEIIFVHPTHPPQRLFFNTGGPAYVWQAITFTNEPVPWDTNNYPAAITSYNGRLVLGGAADFKTAPGDPLATVSETVWLTEVGNWTTFTATPTDPDDSIEFTAIYRSPIQWLFGQKNLLIGAREFEYAALASTNSGVLTPSDVGVFLQSTHGSRSVQPVGFGEGVLFPSDSGTKVRMLSYTEEGNGWVATDMTLFYPEACRQGIVRMVRMRNPHQMCVVLLEDGSLSLFHAESGISGWTKYVLNNAQIKDICVVPNDDGLDVLYMVVNRVIDGSQVTYLECVPNWSEEFEWDYSECTKVYQFETATSVIPDLDHLEGQIVHVYNSSIYVGTYTVSGGSVTLSDGTDTGVTELFNVRVGLMHRAVLQTLPPQKVDPGAPINFTDFAVRIVNSARPIINGQRPPNRRPGMQLGFSQRFEDFEDVEVTTSGWDPYQSIEISEQAPFRSEIIGVYGSLSEGNVS